MYLVVKLHGGWKSQDNMKELISETEHQTKSDPPFSAALNFGPHPSF